MSNINEIIDLSEDDDENYHVIDENSKIYKPKIA